MTRDLVTAPLPDPSPRPGISIAEYVGVRKLQDGAHTLNQFSGVQRFKKAASEALGEIVITKAA